MTIHFTPNYQLAYIDVDTAAVDLAAASQQMAERVDAALLEGGIAPPGAADLVALAARVTALEPTAWANLALTSGATPITGFRVPQYRRAGDVVELRGVLAVGSVPNGQPLLTLPAGSRPTQVEVLSVTSDTNAVRVDVLTTGGITRVNGTGAYVTLAGLSFSTKA